MRSSCPSGPSALGVVGIAAELSGSYPKDENQGIDAVDAYRNTKRCFQAGTSAVPAPCLAVAALTCVTALLKGLAEAQARL